MNKLKIKKNILIIGAEPESINTALALAENGFKITLVTENTYLGGRLNKNRLSASSYGLSDKINKLTNNKNIRVFPGTTVVNTSGAVGNFRVFLSGSEITEINVSFIIISEGTEFISSFDYLSGSFISLTQMNIFFNPDGITRNDMLKIANRTFKNICFYISPDSLSRYFVSEIFDYALFFKKRYGSLVTIILPEVLVAGNKLENMYSTLRDLGVLVVKYQKEPMPDYIDSDNVSVIFENPEEKISGDKFTFDLFIYSEKPVYSEYFREISKILRVNRYNNINFQDIKTPRKGVYICGLCREDLTNDECILDSKAVCEEIVSITENRTLLYEDGVIEINRQKCTLCLTCVRVCPHGAIEMHRDIIDERVIKIYDEACFHCGTCAGECPAKALSFKEAFYKEESIK
jgi:heterodisulfide reductase subunit A2